MEPIHRLSMNTSLKNARIFDDNAWDDDGVTPKKRIKSEPQEDEYEDKVLINDVKDPEKLDIKIENNYFIESIEEGEIKSPLSSTVETPKVIQETPPKIKLEPFDSSLFDESPYNKELFGKCKIADQTPVKIEYPSEKTLSFKSSKRKILSARHSPYKKIDLDNYEKRISAKSRLGPKINETDEKPSYRSSRSSSSRDRLESDTSVISRRQKQIEYGKNTIGYETYTKMVPKDERKVGDPKTPPKYYKYSRRAWEGLIRQWRIKLHKYDPPEVDSNSN